MYCHQCGAKLDDNSNFCSKCGAPTHSEQKDSIEQPNYNSLNTTPQAQQNNTHATDDGMYGILGLVFSFIIPLLGLIFSIIGLNKNNNRSYAKAGLIISIAYFALVFIIVTVVLTSHSHYYYY